MADGQQTEQPAQQQKQVDGDVHTGAPAGDLGEEKLNIPGPLRRNAGLLAVVAAALIVGPQISRVLETFRGIVLEVQDDQMLVALSSRPPRWVAAIDVEMGQVVQKSLGAWSAEPVQTEARDHKLTKLYSRYARAYEGTIVAINPPVTPTGASTAVIDIDGGGRVHVELWAAHLATAAVGRRVRKTPGSWDPHLVAGGEAKPVEVLAPEPSGATGAQHP